MITRSDLENIRQNSLKAKQALRDMFDSPADIHYLSAKKPFDKLVELSDCCLAIMDIGIDQTKGAEARDYMMVDILKTYLYLDPDEYIFPPKEPEDGSPSI